MLHHDNTENDINPTESGQTVVCMQSGTMTISTSSTHAFSFALGSEGFSRS
jgi:hypothetical protein